MLILITFIKAIKMSKLLFWTSFFILYTTAGSAQIQTRSVTVTGIGDTLERAVNKALVNAISQVNGAEIASKARTSLAEESQSIGNNSQISTKESFQEVIRSRTKGLVKSFNFIDRGPHPSLKGMVRVKLSVKITKFKVSKQLKRKRVAVVPFRLGSKVRSKKLGTAFQKSFTTGLEGYLTQTRRFAMLDRNFLSEQNRELNLLRTGAFNTDELARIGNRAGVDLIIVGEIVAAFIKRKTITMQSTGQKITSRRSVGKVIFRVIDVATTQIKFGDTKSISLNGASIQRSGSVLSNKIGKMIINAIYPIRVVSVDRMMLTLGQGGNTVKKGSVYTLVRYGNRIKDPYTNESLGRTETDVGKIRIETVQSKFSTAKILKLNKLVASDINSRDYIVRPFYGNSGKRRVSSKQLLKRVEKDADDALKKLEKKSKDDW